MMKLIAVVFSAVLTLSTAAPKPGLVAASYSSPVLASAPVVHGAPVVASAPVVAAAPAVAYSSPLAYSSGYVAPTVAHHVAHPVAPVAYSSYAAPVAHLV
ncbi:cuticle protein 16.5-like [Aethina tumida]|uniref:cuticle protein 16.5-like n=1 Tax=Aethina tumida TaxID=116153 RepID=UPI0021495266|nr:cuticle protein 16.5-like [Aethina tumida]